MQVSIVLGQYGVKVPKVLILVLIAGHDHAEGELRVPADLVLALVLGLLLEHEGLHALKGHVLAL